MPASVAAERFQAHQRFVPGLAPELVGAQKRVVQLSSQSAEQTLRLVWQQHLPSRVGARTINRCFSDRRHAPSLVPRSPFQKLICALLMFETFPLFRSAAPLLVGEIV